MSLTNKAIFIIERNLARDLSLGWVAENCAVTPFHLTRAFGQSVGIPLMGYVRARRLTIAAKKLAMGASDILEIALDHRYASHEAFSRAFKTRFGITPEDVRAARTTDALALVEPYDYSRESTMELKEPRILEEGELKFVGLSRRVPFDQPQTIGGQWQEFMGKYYGAIGHKLSEPPVGVTTASSEEAIEYVCAAGVSKFGDVPNGCVKVTAAPARYAVFAHDGHVTEIRATYDAIWNDWFPKSDFTPAEAPGLERHNPTFDPKIGNGGATIWIPIIEVRK